MITRHGRTVLTERREILAPQHSALLVIDMQNDLLDERGAYARNGEDTALTRVVLPAVSRLVDAARTAGVLVVYTQNTTLPDGASDSPAWVYFKDHSRPGLGGEYTVRGTWGHQIVPELAPGPRDLVVSKHRSDAFVGTDLEQLLRSHEVRTVVSAGVVTNGCVESTVRHAAFLDLYSLVVGDACASTAPALHDAAMALLAARHDVLAAEDLITLWKDGT